MSAFYFPAVFGILLTIFGTAYGSEFTSEERWKNPCGGNSGADSSWVPTQQPSPSSNIAILEQMEKQCEDAYAMAIKLKRGYADRFQNPFMERLLSHYDYPYLAELKMTTDEKEEAEKNITKSYLESYKKLSIVAVFLEQVAYDENHKEIDGFTAQLANQESKLYDIMCNLHKAIHNTGSNIAEHVTTDVMPDSEREMDSTIERYARDYVIVRDSGKLYSEFNDLFRRLRIALLNQSQKK